MSKACLPNQFGFTHYIKHLNATDLHLQSAQKLTSTAVIDKLQGSFTFFSTINHIDIRALEESVILSLHWSCSKESCKTGIMMAEMLLFSLAYL